MDIEDLASRLLVGISLSIRQGRPETRNCDLEALTDISERHIQRLKRKLKARGLIEYRRANYFCVYRLTPSGDFEAKRLSEYFRLS